jgi:DNA-binding transcriptional LysR family regulator
MKAFVAIAEQRRFAKAAVRLGVSASTLGESLRKLEGRLGVRLIERTTRSVAPTAAGEPLLMRPRPVLEDYEAALESINDFRDKPRGQLRVTGVGAAWDRLHEVFAVPAQIPTIGLVCGAEVTSALFGNSLRLRAKNSDGP